MLMPHKMTSYITLSPSQRENLHSTVTDASFRGFITLEGKPNIELNAKYFFVQIITCKGAKKLPFILCRTKIKLIKQSVKNLKIELNFLNLIRTI